MTSSMTICLLSCVCEVISYLAVAQKPIGVMSMSAAINGQKPAKCMIAIAKGIAPRLPHVPGAGEMRPHPNHVAIRFAGSFREGLCGVLI